MPIHGWRDKKSGKQLEVLRRINEYDMPPTEEELKEAGIEVKDPEWEKVLLSAPNIVKGDNWGGGKGNW